MIAALFLSALSGLVTTPNLHGYAERSTSRPAALVAAATASSDLSPDDVQFPEEIGAIDQALRAASFGLQAGPIVASYLSAYSKMQFRERVLGECLDEDECEVVWEDEHDKGSKALTAAILDLKGFYVKLGQLIASREDLFPKRYTQEMELAGVTDSYDPMAASLVRAIVKQELLNEDETFADVFAEFDDEPLGAASVAQVHRAVLTPAYGGAEVAVKVQRPAIEAKLLGDVAVLKALSKPLRGVTPVDYHVVCCELEQQLSNEFDFVQEAAAMVRISDALALDDQGLPCVPPVVTPRPIDGLVTKRVLVMDYLPGVPLSRAVEAMRERGIDPDSDEAQLFGRKMLRALTDAFGRTILGTGFFHADPHPGNIFVMDDGRVGLIDFGQVKQIGSRASQTLSKIMLALNERTSDTDPQQLDEIGRLALELGVELVDDAPKVGPAATAMWLFDGSVAALPGGFDTSEISPNSPVKVLKSFPQDLTFVARSTTLIKGLAARLGVRWSLADEWAPIARTVLARRGKLPSATLRFGMVLRTFWAQLTAWAASKLLRGVGALPSPLRRALAAVALRLEKARERPRPARDMLQPDGLSTS